MKPSKTLVVVSVRPPGLSSSPAARRIEPPSGDPPKKPPPVEVVVPRLPALPTSLVPSTASSRPTAVTDVGDGPRGEPAAAAPRPLTSGPTQRVASKPAPPVALASPIVSSGLAALRRSIPTRWPRRAVPAAAIAGMVTGLAIGTVLYYRLALGDARAGAAEPATPREAPKAGPLICRVHRSPKRVATEVVRRVAVTAVTTEEGVAIGYAATPLRARGAVVHPTHLSVRVVLRDSSPDAIVRVVPLARGGVLDFAVDRRSLPWPGEPHTVDAKRPFSISRRNGKLVIERQAGREPTTLAVTRDGLEPGPPRVASTAYGRHLVAYRAGGSAGRVFVGWIAGTSRRLLAPVAITTPAGQVGKPSVAASDSTGIVATSIRAGPKSPWTVRLGLAEPGKAPGALEPFVVPAGGPGGDSMAPRLAALDDGGWLLQWTEGRAGAHVVRAQTLDPELEPLGDPMQISPPGVNSGEGATVATEGGALSLFLVRSAARYELWATALECVGEAS